MSPAFSAKPAPRRKTAFRVKIAAAALFGFAGFACVQDNASSATLRQRGGAQKQKSAQTEAAQPASLPPMSGDTSTFGPKTRTLTAPQNAAFEAGVLILAPEGGINWRRKMERVSGALRRKMPVEISFGAADLRALQPALDKLAARGVKKIIAAPAFLFTRSQELDESRYLLGLAEQPVKYYSQSRAYHPTFHQMGMETQSTITPRRQPISPQPARARNYIPLVMMPALDETNLPFAALSIPTTSFASVIDSPVSLVITAAGPEDEDEYRLTQVYLEMLAGSLKRKYSLQNARAELLFSDNSKAGSGFQPMGVELSSKLEQPRSAGERGRKSREDLRNTVMEFSKTSKTLVLGYSPDDDELDKMVNEALNGAFYKWGGTIELSEAALAAWLENMAQAGLKLEPGPVYVKTANSNFPA